jgi:hypothetical protein
VDFVGIGIDERMINLTYIDENHINSTGFELFVMMDCSSSIPNTIGATS